MKGRTFLKLGLLALLAFFIQTTMTPHWGAFNLDLLFLFTLVGAYRWNVYGGLTAGIFSGLLVGTVSSVPPLQLVFFYGLVGYLCALLIDITRHETVGHRVGLSVTLSLLYGVALNALFVKGGVMRLEDWSFDSVPLHALGILVFLQAAEFWSVDSDEKRNAGGHGVMRNILA